MLVVAVLLAIVGARLYHVISEPQGTPLGWSYYKENPLAILAIWRGGLGIYGAIVGGALGVLLYTRAHHLRSLRWLDFCAPGMAIGQAIGRWGNYMNRELYGPPTDLPWGLHIPARYRIPPYTDLTRYPLDTRFHPTFLYESLAALGLCLLLLWFATHRARQLKEGDLLLGYLIGYSVIRFFTEFLRPDAWMLGGIAAAQVVALGLVALGTLVLVIRHWPRDGAA
jgi:phosphatidylglycerol:prolipoprotein diacylglycerol transferase